MMFRWHLEYTRAATARRRRSTAAAMTAAVWLGLSEHTKK